MYSKPDNRRLYLKACVSARYYENKLLNLHPQLGWLIDHDRLYVRTCYKAYSEQ